MTEHGPSSSAAEPGAGFSTVEANGRRSRLSRVRISRQSKPMGGDHDRAECGFLDSRSQWEAITIEPSADFSTVEANGRRPRSSRVRISRQSKPMGGNASRTSSRFEARA